MARALCLMIAVVSLGCAHTYERIRPDTSTIPPQLSRDATVYVATCEDGRYGKINYPGSGLATAHAVRVAFLRHVARVGIGSKAETESDAITRARQDGYSHTVVPTILHWEDRATEWSGRPDRIEVKLSLIEVASGKALDVVRIKGKSRWATFGGDNPEDLLPDPVTAWVNGLFGHADR